MTTSSNQTSIRGAWVYTGYGSADWYAKDPDATGSTYGSFAFPVIIVPYVRMTEKKEEIMVWV